MLEGPGFSSLLCLFPQRERHQHMCPGQGMERKRWQYVFILSKAPGISVIPVSERMEWRLHSRLWCRLRPTQTRPFTELSRVKVVLKEGGTGLGNILSGTVSSWEVENNCIIVTPRQSRSGDQKINKLITLKPSWGLCPGWKWCFGGRVE